MVPTRSILRRPRPLGRSAPTTRLARWARSAGAMVTALLTIAATAAPLSAQHARRSPLDDLVELGLKQNLTRKQEVLAVARAEAAVREARGLYLPSATFNARYTELSGNTINLGTLINPAFGALNQLLDRPAFPTNVDIQLPQRQETTLRLAQPVFRPDIIAANRVRGALADAQVATRDVQARQLTRRSREPI